LLSLFGKVDMPSRSVRAVTLSLSIRAEQLRGNGLALGQQVGLVPVSVASIVPIGVLPNMPLGAEEHGITDGTTVDTAGGGRSMAVGITTTRPFIPTTRLCPPMLSLNR
jgi:hypothetical protein